MMFRMMEMNTTVPGVRVRNVVNSRKMGTARIREKIRYLVTSIGISAATFPV